MFIKRCIAIPSDSLVDCHLIASDKDFYQCCSEDDLGCAAYQCVRNRVVVLVAAQI